MSFVVYVYKNSEYLQITIIINFYITYVVFIFYSIVWQNNFVLFFFTLYCNLIFIDLDFCLSAIGSYHSGIIYKQF